MQLGECRFHMDNELMMAEGMTNHLQGAKAEASVAQYYSSSADLHPSEANDYGHPFAREVSRNS